MLDDGEMATVTAAGFTTMRHSDLASTGKTASEVDIDASAYDAGDHESYMHKEILEQPDDRAGGAARAGSTSASAPRTSAASTWTPATCAPCAG